MELVYLTENATIEVLMWFDLANIRPLSIIPTPELSTGGRAGGSH
jgi:hypothetical protein